MESILLGFPFRPSFARGFDFAFAFGYCAPLHATVCPSLNQVGRRPAFIKGTGIRRGSGFGRNRVLYILYVGSKDDSTSARKKYDMCHTVGLWSGQSGYFKSLLH